MKNIKGKMLIGIILIVLGAAAIIYDQSSYTRQEKLFDIGPFQATVEKEAHCVRLPVIFGVLVILAGAYLVWAHVRKYR